MSLCRIYNTTHISLHAPALDVLTSAVSLHCRLLITEEGSRRMPAHSSAQRGAWHVDVRATGTPLV